MGEERRMKLWMVSPKDRHSFLSRHPSCLSLVKDLTAGPEGILFFLFPYPRHPPIGISTLTPLSLSHQSRIRFPSSMIGLRWMDLRDVWIDPQYQGQGWGTWMIQRLFSRIRRLHLCDHLKLDVYHKNIRALRLYQKNGFQSIPHLPTQQWIQKPSNFYSIYHFYPDPQQSPVHTMYFSFSLRTRRAAVHG